MSFNLADYINHPELVTHNDGTVAVTVEQFGSRFEIKWEDRIKCSYSINGGTPNSNSHDTFMSVKPIPNLISIDKEYKTKDGREVRVLCTNNTGVYSVVALINYDVYTYDKYGNWRADAEHHALNLVEVKPEVWLNVYEGSVYKHPSKEAADKGQKTGGTRLACIREGEGL